jgi:ubiquinone/menaquinone biosynthesis C-methylase UbiE
MRSINQEEYYHKIKNLNILHYTGEVPYYEKAPLRKVEKAILSKLKPNSEILDLGCGAGRFSIGAAEMGFNVTGIDITPDSIKTASRKSEFLNLKNVKFLVGDMIELPFEGGVFDYVFCPRFSINAVATFSRREKTIQEMIRVVKNNGTIFIESFNKLYLGKGPILFLKNMLRDIWRYFSIFFSYLLNEEYKGLLPGDIIYESNKIAGAPQGYAHLPTVCELKKLIPRNTKYRFYSIPQIVENKKMDIYKFFRYSIWIFLKN